jgi:hypothetical protein
MIFVYICFIRWYPLILVFYETKSFHSSVVIHGIIQEHGLQVKTEITLLFHWHCYSVDCSWQLLHQHGSKRNMHLPIKWQIRHWTMWELCWPLENRIMKYNGKSLTTVTLNIEIKVIMFLYYILFSVLLSPLNRYTIICSSKHSPPLPLLPPTPPPPITYLAEVNGLPNW